MDDKKLIKIIEDFKLDLLKDLPSPTKQRLTADEPIHGITSGAPQQNDLLVLDRQVSPGVWENFSFKIPPQSIFNCSELPNSNSNMLVGYTHINRTVISPENPTYTLPNGDSNAIPNGSVIRYINIGTNNPTIITSGPDSMIVEGNFTRTQIRPTIIGVGTQPYIVQFERVGSSLWFLTVSLPFNGALNPS